VLDSVPANAQWFILRDITVQNLSVDGNRDGRRPGPASTLKLAVALTWPATMSLLSRAQITATTHRE